MRPPRSIFGAVVLAVVLWAGTWLVPEPSVATDDGLVFSASTRYELVAEERLVRVIVDGSVTSVTPDTATHRIFYSSITIPVLPGAESVRAQSGGAAIGATITEEAEDYTAVEVTFGQGVFFQQTYRFQLTFDLPERAGDAGREVRVGSSFASFPVWAFGTAGAAAGVEVVIPEGYVETLLAGDLESTPLDDGRTLLAANDIPEPSAFFAYVTAERPGARAREELSITIGDESARVVLLAWEDDPGWLERTRPILEEGLPLLSEEIGLPYPVVGPLRVSEHAFGRLGDYAGTFNPVTDAIEIRYDADAFVGLHEAAHVWFNGGLVGERWIGEAFASHYAEAVGTALGFEMEIFEVTPALEEHAFPLNEWDALGREDTSREEYAYPATLEVARQIAAIAGEDGLRAVWRAMDASELAYQPSGEAGGQRGVPSSAESWMRLLDLLEERTGEDFDPIWVEWIVTDAERALLEERDAARRAYADVRDAAGDWALPRDLRIEMDGWEFDEATETIAAVEVALGERELLEERAAALGLAAPGTVREAFESDGPEAASREVDALLGALDRLERANERLARDAAPVEIVGQLGEADPERSLATARQAFEEGDHELAQAHAAAAIEARRAAADRGTVRVVAGGGLLLALDAAAMGALLLRRRAPRPLVG